MELVTTVITPVVKSLMDVVKRHLSFCFYSTNNVRDMRAGIEKLVDTARDLKEKKEKNDANNLVVPHHVPAWLANVETICENARKIRTGGIGCLNLKIRYKEGKRSSDILKDIDRLMKEKSEIEWSDEQRPPGRVRSTGASTSKSVATATDDNGTQTGLKSRDFIFKEAMKSLDPNNKIQKIALCGMGGVGKTTMMDQLKKAVEGNKLFDWVMKVDIGKNPNPINLQQTVAEYFGKPLLETVKDTRAKSLLDRFVGISENGEKNILVIMDDLWEEVDLKDIGLTNPLPKGFKLLLTSREEKVCTRMGVEASSTFRIVVLEEPEAKKLFWEIAGTLSDGNIDHDLRKIGEDIVKKCGGLPIAIKTIASTLRDNNVKDVWVNALESLRNKELSFVETVFKTSYENLKDDDEKATFLLSGLFPDDYNIPVEDLMRYGWGLKLFKSSKTISTARRKVNTCVNNLIHSNMLIESDCKECVKMHDLVRDFVLRKFSIVKQVSLVNSDDISEQLREESYERILLKCIGMCEFPADFNHPNLALLKLLDGDNLDTFPKDFYDRMQKLEVVAYERIRQPLLPRYSTTLRTLCLRSCSLVDDISFIGDLINLEVLSFAFCKISKLPSAIGNLKKLKLLDLTDCFCLRIDDGVFHKLEKLRELYMRAYKGKLIRFTEDSCEGLKMLSRRLIALDVEFFESIIQPKNLSFEKLERFRISMGCRSEDSGNEVYAYENTLKLVVSCNELLECKINELFEKTEKLDLSVNEMSSLEQISMYPSQHSFCNVRVLYVYECADLTSIFTVNVASSLTKLESLTVSECPLLESLVQGENSEAKVIKFHKLKLLTLKKLPMFVSLFDTDQVMELPQLVELMLDDLPNVSSIFFENNEISATRQPLLNKRIPNLKKLYIKGMKKLKEIWSCDNTSISVEDVNAISNLRQISVDDCPSLVNLFPCNPMRLLGHLAVINGQKQQTLSLFHNLKTITMKDCKSIKYLFSPLMATHISNLKRIVVHSCDGMEEVVSNRDDNEDEQMTAPTTTTLFPHLDELELFALPSLKHVGGDVAKGTTNDINDHLKYSQVPVVCWTLCQYSRKIKVAHCPAMSHVIPSYVAGKFLMVEMLDILDCIVMKEVFVTTDINNSGGLSSNFEERSGGTDTALAIPRLTRYQQLCDTDQVIELPQLVDLRLNNLPNVTSIFYEISATTQPLLNKKIVIPNLEKLEISNMKMLKEIWSCENTSISENYVNNIPMLREILVTWCDSLVNLFPGNPIRLLSHLAVVYGQKQQTLSLFHNLTTIHLVGCKSIKYLFSPLLATHLYNLKKVRVYDCDGIEEVVSNRDDNVDEEMTAPTTTTLFPHLDELSLERMHGLKHVGGGVAKGTKNVICDQLENSQVPVVCWSLCQYSRKIIVSNCSAMSNVVPSYVAGQILMVESLHIADCIVMKEVFATTDINNSGGLSSYFEERSGGIDTAHAIPRLTIITAHKLLNLKTMYIQNCNSLEHIFTFSTLESLTKIEEISINSCKAMKVIVREENGEQTLASKVIVFHRLKSIILRDLPNLEGFFLGMSKFKWPLLDDVKIKRCPKMMAFTSNKSTAPKLKYIRLTLGNYNPECCNFYVTANSPQSPSLSLKNEPLSLRDLIEVNVKGNTVIEEIFASNELIQLPNLEKIHVKRCKSVKTVFEVESEVTDGELNRKSQTFVKFPKLREVNLEKLYKLKYIWKNNIQGMKLEFPNLTRLSIHKCPLRYVLTSLMVGSLMQLQDLHITNCYSMEVIVKDEENTKEEVSIEDEEDEENTEEEVEECDGDGDGKVSEIIVFPCLKSLKLERLHSLEGFYLGKEVDVSLPSLNTIVIKQCPDLETFNKGHVAAPQLKVIETGLGLISVGEQDINSFIITKSQEGLHFAEESSDSDDEQMIHYFGKLIREWEENNSSDSS